MVLSGVIVSAIQPNEPQDVLTVALLRIQFESMGRRRECRIQNLGRSGG